MASSPGVQRIAQLLMAQQPPVMAPAPMMPSMIQPQGRYIMGGYMPNSFDAMGTQPYALPPDKNTYDPQEIMMDTAARRQERL